MGGWKDRRNRRRHYHHRPTHPSWPSVERRTNPTHDDGHGPADLFLSLPPPYGAPCAHHALENKGRKALQPRPRALALARLTCGPVALASKEERRARLVRSCQRWKTYAELQRPGRSRVSIPPASNPLPRWFPSGWDPARFPIGGLGEYRWVGFSSMHHMPRSHGSLFRQLRWRYCPVHVLSDRHDRCLRNPWPASLARCTIPFARPH